MNNALNEQTKGNESNTKSGLKPLQHEEPMNMKNRIEESQAYGEKYRADHQGADVREAVQPATSKTSGDDDQSTAN